MAILVLVCYKQVSYKNQYKINCGRNMKPACCESKPTEWKVISIAKSPMILLKSGVLRAITNNGDKFSSTTAIITQTKKTIFIIINLTTQYNDVHGQLKKMNINYNVAIHSMKNVP